MPPVCPRLRSDLVISRQETSGSVVYVIKDPGIGRFVRLKEPEYFIAEQLDGATPLEEVLRRGEEKFGASISIAGLEQFAGKLQNLGLLSTPGQTVESRTSEKAGKLRGNLFYLRFRLFDPDTFLSQMAPRLSFVFTSWFGWFSVATIATAISVMILSWEEIHHNFPLLIQPGALALAWVTLLTVVMGHELAHGLTCKRYGGSVHEIGMLMIYLQPAMYCNVSDAWLFPEKKKRLLVTLAGAWFEVFCWAVAAILWRLTEPGTMPNFLCFVVATTLGIKSLFNLNPLLKLDGYYLLSDYLEIPNLRAKAFQHMGGALSRLWRSNSVTATPPGPRERRIYWIYGLLAAIYSTWLLGFILLSLGSYLTGRYQAWGGALFAGFVLLIFRGPLRRGRHLLASFFSAKTGMIRAMKRVGRVVVICGLAAAALFFIKAEFKVSGEFTILPIHNADIRPEVEGIVQEIVHDEGDVVNAGDLIARLSDHDYRSELEKVKAELAEKGARLKMLKAGARIEEVELAKTTVTKGEQRVKHSKSLLEMEKTLYEDKLSSKKDFEVAAEVAALRESELQESKGTLKLLLAGPRAEEIEATEAEVTRLAAQFKYFEGQLERLRITSPITGMVTTHRLKERLGANLKKGELFAQVHQVKTVNAEIAIPENEISEVHIGQPVVLKARAYIDQSFQGKVIATSPVGITSTNGVPQRHFLVITELGNGNQALRPEMTGNAKISCGTRPLYQIVFRRLIRFIRVEFWSWW